MNRDTIKHGVRGGGSSLASSAINMALNLIAVIILSRLLEPEDFGLIAMVQAIIALGEVLKEAGISTAALQEKSLSKQQSSNLFWVNVILAVVVFALLLLSTPLVVSFFNEPRLVAILPAAAVPILIHGIGGQIRVDLARQFRFHALAISSVLSQATGVVLAVLLAMFGFGYWALVGQSVASALVLLIIQWFLAGWRPSIYRRGNGTLRQVKIGVHYALNQLLIFVENGAASMILGRTVGAVSLGNYNRASTLVQTPLDGVLGPLQRIVVPLLNRLETSREQTGSAFVLIQHGLGWIVLGTLSAASGAASLIIPMLLGDGWKDASIVFGVLALGGCLQVFNSVNYWIFVNREQSKSYLKYNLCSRPIAVLALLVGAQFGLVGVAWAYFASKVIGWLVGLLWLRHIGFSDALGLLKNGCILLTGALASSLSASAVVGAMAEVSAIVSLGVALFSGLLVLSLVIMLFPSTRIMTLKTLKLIR